ncbi:MAG: hypothetical protein SGI86_22410 [Deltaproteobacteria bacterium]|nr:hypothetical protein [Deltaproteobacteria bacterium]
MNAANPMFDATAQTFVFPKRMTDPTPTAKRTVSLQRTRVMSTNAESHKIIGRSIKLAIEIDTPALDLAILQCAGVRISDSDVTQSTLSRRLEHQLVIKVSPTSQRLVSSYCACVTDANRNFFEGSLRQRIKRSAPARPTREIAVVGFHRARTPRPGTELNKFPRRYFQPGPSVDVSPTTERSSLLDAACKWPNAANRRSTY